MAFFFPDEIFANCVRPGIMPDMWFYFKFYAHYIFSAQTRQGLLLLAMGGLFLSSFALQALQGAMQGLQNAVMTRAKKIDGQAVLRLQGIYQEVATATRLQEQLAAFGWPGYLALESEVLLRHQNFLAPGLARAYQSLPPFLAKKTVQDIVLPRDLAYHLQAVRSDEIQLISPAATRFFMADIPGEVSGAVSDFLVSRVPEVDSTYLWPRLGLLQNLLRQKIVNRIYFYEGVDLTGLANFVAQQPQAADLHLETWEEQNDTLVWSLKLEGTIMVLLFSAMAFLVSLSITSGMMAFLAKAKEDLASFWLLGAPAKRVAYSVRGFVYLASALVVATGVGSGMIFLKILASGKIILMPDIFIDRTIPAVITLKSVLLAFGIPYVMAIICVQYAINKFMQQTSYLAVVRKNN